MIRSSNRKAVSNIRINVYDFVNTLQPKEPSALFCLNDPGNTWNVISN